MKPPLFYRLVVNPLRAWLERDDRLLVEQWRDAFKPAPRLKVRPFLNLRVSRSARKVA